METEVTQYRHCDLVKLTGRLDDFGVEVAQKAFDSITGSKRYRIIVDMSGVNFVSSKGWWLLIGLQKTCKKLGRGEVVLANLESRIEKSLNLVGMQEYFRVFPDLTSAIGNI